MKKRRELTAEEKQWAANLKRLWSGRAIDPLTGKKTSQERAAEMAGWGAQSTVSQYINGVIPLNTDAILAFASIIPCKPEDINPELALLGAGSLDSSDISFLRRFLGLSQKNKKTLSAVADSLAEDQGAQ